jgi:hypothetical protein
MAIFPPGGSSMRRFLLDNDGSNLFYNLGDDPAAAVDEAVRECPASVTTYLQCSGAGSSYWPTRIGHVDPRATGLVAAHARGIDPLGMLLRGLKASGKETFITLRMNDVHNPTDADQWNTPRIRQEHPDVIVGADEVRAGRAEWMSYCLDYGRDEVRRWTLSLLEEQVALYGGVVDGFQLDWMRFPRHLSGAPDQVWERRGVISDFMADVRAVLGKSGRQLLLSARVPTSPAGCRRLGFDLADWGARGLVDFLVACPFLTTEWHVPVEDLRAWSGGAFPVYAGFDFGFGEQSHFSESLRGACSALYDCGADGIYLFNFPCWTEYLAARPYHWLRGLDTPGGAAEKPLLLAVDHSRHRLSGIDQAAPLPAPLAAEAETVLPVWVPARTLPAWRSLCLIQSGGDVGLSLNGQPAAPANWWPQTSSAHRSEIFVEFVDQYWNKDARPRPEDCRAFRVDPASLRPGWNQLAVANRTGNDLEIRRVNLALW